MHSLPQNIKQEIEVFLKETFFKPKAVYWYGSAYSGQIARYKDFIFSDYDILVVSSFAPLYVLKYNFLQKSSSGNSLNFSTPRRFLRRLDFQKYEIKESSELIYGKDLRQHMNVTLYNLPKWEGLRYIFNTLFDLSIEEKEKFNLEKDPKAFYKIVKVYVAIAKCISVFDFYYEYDLYKILQQLDNHKKYINNDLYYRVRWALKFKLNKDQNKKKNFSKGQVLEDALFFLDKYLQKYIAEGLSLEQNLLTLSKRMPKSFLGNLFFYFRTLILFKRPILKTKKIYFLSGAFFYKVLVISFFDYSKAKGDFENYFRLDFNYNNLFRLASLYSNYTVLRDFGNKKDKV